VAYLLVHSIKGLHFLQVPAECCVHILHQLLPLLTASSLAACGPGCQQLLQSLLELLCTLHRLLAQKGQLCQGALITAQIPSRRKHRRDGTLPTVCAHQD
jgi:hypothetical protein